MKKRSLLAAVAMLIVSAIVLTSATYAWFVVGTDAKIDGVQATVSTADSGVQLRVADLSTAWTSTLAPNALIADTTNNKFVDSYKPTSGRDNSGVMAFLAGAFENSVLTTTAGVAGTDYTMFKTLIRSTGADAVNVSLDVTIADEPGNTCSKGLKVAVVFTDFSATTHTLLGIFGDAYSAINTASTFTDSNGDAIITAADAAGAYTSNLTAQTLDDDNTVTITGVDNSGTDYITVYMWVEGNDVDCTNALASQVASVDLDFSVV